MKKKKSLITYLFLAFAIMLLSVSTTLALVRDDEKKASGIITFDKVVLMGDVEGGSKLSVTPIEKPYTDGDVLFDYTQDNQELTFKAASDTVDFYVSVRATFETKKELTADQQAILDEINASLAPVKGITPYKCDDYGYTYLNGWYHLATEENGEFLKVVSPNEEYIISRFYRLDLGADLDPIKKETFLTMFDEEALGLKIEVKATQAYGVSSIVTPETPNAAENNNAAAIISGNGVISKEEYYGFAKIAQLMQSIWDNMGCHAITIIFDKNDDRAVGTIENKIIYYGQTLELPMEGYSIDKSMFEGWSILPADGEKLKGTLTYEKINELAQGKKILTLYVVWRGLIVDLNGVCPFPTSFTKGSDGIYYGTNKYGTWKAYRGSHWNGNSNYLTSLVFDNNPETIASIGYTRDDRDGLAFWEFDLELPKDVTIKIDKWNLNGRSPLASVQGTRADNGIMEGIKTGVEYKKIRVTVYQYNSTGTYTRYLEVKSFDITEGTLNFKE